MSFQGHRIWGLTVEEPVAFLVGLLLHVACIRKSSFAQRLHNHIVRTIAYVCAGWGPPPLLLSATASPPSLLGQQQGRLRETWELAVFEAYEQFPPI